MIYLIFYNKFKDYTCPARYIDVRISVSQITLNEADHVVKYVSVLFPCADQMTQAEYMNTTTHD